MNSVQSIIESLHTRVTCRVDEDMRNISSINRKNTFNVPREYYVKLFHDGTRVKDSWIREANKYLRFIAGFVVGVIDSENKVIVGDETIQNTSRGMYANVISFSSRDILDMFIDELNNYTSYKSAKELIEKQNLFDKCVYRGDKREFTSISDYMSYRLSIIKKDLDTLSTLFNGDSLLSPIYGDSYTDLRKCKVTIIVESNDTWLNSPVKVNCYCNFSKCLKDNKDLEFHLKSMNNSMIKGSQYSSIEYMEDFCTLVVTF